MGHVQKEIIIREILKDSTLTTLEIERKMSRQDLHCPDDLIKTLNQMRKKNLINGKLSIEKGAWVWWVEE